MLLLIALSVQPGQGQTAPANLSCQPFKIGTDTSGLPEIQGRSATQTLWALLFPYHLPVWSDEDLKIVWRMTGAGNFSLEAQHTDGTVTQPIWGPDAHSGSSWQRPGDEWGTGFHFPEAGCWRILVQRGVDTGEVDLLVVPNEYVYF
jgi:hypothetical protein